MQVPPRITSPKRAAQTIAALGLALLDLTLSGVQNRAASAPSGGKPALVRVPVQWVKVDRQPVPELALDQWAVLPAGKHIVTLQPFPGLSPQDLEH